MFISLRDKVLRRPGCPLYLLCAYGQDMSRQKTVTTAEKKTKVRTFDSPKNVMWGRLINSYKYLLRTYYRSGTVLGTCHTLVNKYNQNFTLP